MGFNAQRTKNTFVKCHKIVVDYIKAAKLFLYILIRSFVVENVKGENTSTHAPLCIFIKIQCMENMKPLTYQTHQLILILATPPSFCNSAVPACVSSGFPVRPALPPKTRPLFPLSGAVAIKNWIIKCHHCGGRERDTMERGKTRPSPLISLIKIAHYPQ